MPGKTDHTCINPDIPMLDCKACCKRLARDAHKRHLPATLDTCSICLTQKRQEKPVGMSKKQRKAEKRRLAAEEAAKTSTAVITKPPESAPKPLPRVTLTEAQVALSLLASIDDGEFLENPVRVLVTYAVQQRADAWERAGRDRLGKVPKPWRCPEPQKCQLPIQHAPLPCKPYTYIVEWEKAEAARKARGEPEPVKGPLLPSYDTSWEGHTHVAPSMFESGCPRCKFLQDGRIKELQGDKTAKAARTARHCTDCACTGCNWETLSAAVEDPDTQGYSPKQGPILYVKEISEWVKRHQRANRHLEGPKIVGKAVMLVESTSQRTVYEFKSNSCGHLWVARGLPSDALECPQLSCKGKKLTSFNAHFILPTDAPWEEFLEWEKEFYGRGAAAQSAEVLLPKELREDTVERFPHGYDDEDDEHGPYHGQGDS